MCTYTYKDVYMYISRYQIILEILHCIVASTITVNTGTYLYSCIYCAFMNYRGWFASATAKSGLYVHGGVDGDNTRLADLHVLTA
jgi:hypothetical protein